MNSPQEERVHPSNEKALSNVERYGKRHKTSADMRKEIILRFLKKVFLLILGYVLCYFNLSLTLPLVGICSYVWYETRTSDKGEKISRKFKSCSMSKQDILNVVEELPSWVMFPDRERAEWLNEIILQLWPNIVGYIVKFCKGNLQNKIRKKFDSFRFEDINFGESPPKIDGVKVYRKGLSKDCIVMDFDVFYDGNCDITVSLSGTEVGTVKNFQMGVEVRLVLKPILMKMPIIGGMQVFFLNTPDIDFDLEGISGIPGFSYFVRQKIEEQITKKLVFPNKTTKKFTKSIESAELKSLEPEGVLRVHVFEAKDLEKKDMTGKSDPYVILHVGAQEYKTQVIKRDLNPKWDYWCEFIVIDPIAQQLHFKMFDQDDFDNDDFMGSGVIEIHKVIKEGENDQWFTLDQAKHGKLHLRFTWLGLSSNIDDLTAALEETKLLKVKHISMALLTVYVDSAQNLPQVKPYRKPDPYLILTVGKNQKKSRVKKHTISPNWEQGFSILVGNPENDTLIVTVLDKHYEQKLDELVYQLNQLFNEPELEISKKEFSFQKEKNSKIVLSLQLRILKNALFEMEEESESEDDELPVSGIERNSFKSSFKAEHTREIQEMPISKKLISSEVQSAKADYPNVENVIRNASFITKPEVLGRIDLSLEYSEMRQKLIVTVHKVSNIPLKDPDHIPDPYVKLKLVCPGANSIKSKTKVVIDDCNPVYEETFEYPISESDVANYKLIVLVKTKKMFNSRVIGQAALDFKNVKSWDEPIREWFELTAKEDSD